MKPRRIDFISSCRVGRGPCRADGAGGAPKPNAVENAKRWLKSTLPGFGVDPQKALTIMPFLEKVFARDMQGFERAVSELAAFCILACKEPKSPSAEDYLSTLKLFNDPRLIFTGIRLAQIIYIKTSGDAEEVKGGLIDLPIELFNHDPDLFSQAVERLTQTRFCLEAFTAGLQVLRQVYAGRPRGFVEGLDVLDRFHLELEKMGAEIPAINRIFHETLPALAKVFVKSPPEWLGREIDKFTKLIKEMKGRGLVVSRVLEGNLLWFILSCSAGSPERYQLGMWVFVRIVTGGFKLDDPRYNLLPGVSKKAIDIHPEEYLRLMDEAHELLDSEVNPAQAFKEFVDRIRKKQGAD
jgi:hypothetical protein